MVYFWKISQSNPVLFVRSLSVYYVSSLFIFNKWLSIKRPCRFISPFSVNLSNRLGSFVNRGLFNKARNHVYLSPFCNHVTVAPQQCFRWSRRSREVWCEAAWRSFSKDLHFVSNVIAVCIGHTYRHNSFYERQRDLVVQTRIWIWFEHTESVRMPFASLSSGSNIQIQFEFWHYEVQTITPMCDSRMKRQSQL